MVSFIRTEFAMEDHVLAIVKRTSAICLEGHETVSTYQYANFYPITKITEP